MKPEAMVHIPLKFAHLCIDCDCVSASHKQCPSCASTALLPLAGVLDRKPKAA